MNVEGEDGSSDAVSFEWGAPHPDHLTIHIESTFLPAYPRFPFVDLVEPGGVFTFHQCTAVYDPPGDRTHVIEAIPNCAGSGLTEGTPFRLFSLSPKESEGFAPVGGRTYVHANNEFVPEANAYVFGQGLHYSGQGGPVATVTDLASGKQIPAVRTASGYECIFVAVPLSIDFSTSSVRVLDVVIGNTAQGLVITHAGPTGAVSFTDTLGGTKDGFIEGSIEKLSLSRAVTPISGSDFTARMDLSLVEFSMPLFTDDHGFASLTDAFLSRIKLGCN